MRRTTYRRLDQQDREEISRGLAAGYAITTISRHIDRNVSTVSREVVAGGGYAGYRADGAGQRASRFAAGRRRGKTKLAGSGRLRQYVHAGILKCWSPQEVARRMRTEYPHDMTMRISHEAIYDHLYVLPRGRLRKSLLKALRREHKYRRKMKKVGSADETRGKIADMISIDERPAEVAARTVPGHWEGDLIIGKHMQSAIGTLVERVTRYTIIVPLRDGKDSESVRKAYAKALLTLPAEIRKTLTYDQGKEMSGHARFTKETGIKVYFAHPASPWQRGTNENTNGLIRQYFPKGTDFRTVPTRELKRVQRQLNDRPRQILDYLKPDEVFNRLVALNV
jgi:transposase, IS30 family